jgi:hypothetical protein
LRSWFLLLISYGASLAFRTGGMMTVGRAQAHAGEENEEAADHLRCNAIATGLLDRTEGR